MDQGPRMRKQINERILWVSVVSHSNFCHHGNNTWKNQLRWRGGLFASLFYSMVSWLWCLAALISEQPESKGWKHSASQYPFQNTSPVASLPYIRLHLSRVHHCPAVPPMGYQRFMPDSLSDAVDSVQNNLLKFWLGHHTKVFKWKQKRNTEKYV